MVRKMLVLVMLLMLAGCKTYEPVVWIGGTANVEESEEESIGLRTGLRQGQFEGGYSSNWWLDVDNESPYLHGIYGIYHLPEPLSIAAIKFTGYTGVQYAFSFDNDAAAVRLIIGTILPGGAFIEYRREEVSGKMEQYLTDENKIAAGWRIPLR